MKDQSVVGHAVVSLACVGSLVRHHEMHYDACEVASRWCRRLLNRYGHLPVVASRLAVHASLFSFCSENVQSGRVGESLVIYDSHNEADIGMTYYTDVYDTLSN